MNLKGDFFLDTLFKVQISLRTHAAASEPIFSRQINTGIRSIYFFHSKRSMAPIESLIPLQFAGTEQECLSQEQNVVDPCGAKFTSLGLKD